MDKKNGISNDHIKCIFKDSRGYLWIGTEYGLNRYDGYSVKTFYNDKDDTLSISDNYIIDIQEDHKGKLWVDAMNVTNVFDPVTETFTRNTNKYLNELKLPGSSVFKASLKDKDGNIWYLLPLGLYKYIVTGNEILTVVELKPDLINPNPVPFNNLVDDSRGNIWLVYSNGTIEKIDAKSLKTVYKDDFLYKKYKKNNLHVELCADKDDDIWLAVNNYAYGAYLFDTRRHQFIHFHSASPNLKINNDIVSSITNDDRGMIWLGTDHGGINLVNKNDFKVTYIVSSPENDNGLNHNSITYLYKDNDDIIWIGTYKKGINYYHPDIFKFHLYRNNPANPKSLPFNDINCYAEDNKGNLWIGTNGEGLVYFNRKKNEFFSLQHDSGKANTISSNTVTCLLIDHSNRLWIGTFFGGLNYYENNKFVNYSPDAKDNFYLPGKNIWSISEDRDNNIWVGTLEKGLYKFNKQKRQFEVFRDANGNTVNANCINCMMEDRSGNLWFGTTSGLRVLDKSTGLFAYYNREDDNINSLISNGIYKIIEDKRGLIWIATRKGLNLFNDANKTFRSFAREDGLASDLLLSMVEDNNGNLWIGTPNGISNLIITENEGYDSLLFGFKNYDASDGLQGNEFNQFSAYKTRKGEIIFGGPDGLNIFFPDDFHSSKTIPCVVLTELSIFNKPVGIGDPLNNRIILEKSLNEIGEIVLFHRENVFSIEFAALNYFNSQKVMYQYILEGFNKEWMYANANQREVTYTNLFPGKYTFKVRASNHDGIWNGQLASLNIRILPPWWRTYWFRILLFLSIASITLIMYALRIRGFKSQKYLLEAKVNERTSELSQANILLQEQQEEITNQNYELEQHRNHLELLVKERTDELEKAKQRAEEADRLKSAFLANMSHEIRTPMNAIVGFASLLDSPDITQEEMKKYVEFINNNSDTLLVLINDLLEISLIEANQIKITPVVFDVNEILEELEGYFNLKNSKNIIIRYMEKGKHLTIYNDVIRFRQVISNLIGNAYKYTDGGYIRFGFSEVNDKVQFYVSDTGVGIKKEDYSLIFDYFHKIETSKTKLYGGTGIGLSISKKLVGLMGGEIWLESEEGKGATFYLTLPGKVKSVPVIKEEQKAETGNISLKEVSILVAEDEPANYFLIKEAFKKFKSEIVWAKNGEEAVDYVKNNPFKRNLIVFMDIKMPVMNGVEALHLIKEINNKIPVIATTAYANEMDKTELMQHEFSDYITKPLKPAKLFDLIIKHI